MFRIIFVCLFTVGVLGCSKQPDEPKKKEMALKKKTALSPAVDGSPFIVPKLPPDIQRVDANLEKKAILLGYTINTDVAAPGQALVITWYWKSLAQIKGNWEYFTHLIDEDGVLVQSVNSQGAMRSKYKPQMWKPGEILKDVERITVPQTWSSGVLELRTGLWQGPTRLSIVKGPVDAENRIKGPVITISADIPKPVARNVTASEIPFVAKPIQVDGKIDEKVWDDAKRLDSFTNTVNGSAVKTATNTRLLWNNQFLYVAVEAEDVELQSPFMTRDEELWRADALDFFFQPEENGPYYEIQVSPQGTIFDSFYSEYRNGAVEWDSKTKVAVSLDGVVNDNASPDVGWSVEMAIPLSSLAKKDTSAIGEGDTLLANFFRIDKSNGTTEFSGWSPPMRGDFHALERFGQITLKK